LSGNFSPGFPDPKIFALHFTGIIWSFLRDVILVPTRTERKNAQITSKIIRTFRFNRKSADDIFDLTKNFWFKKLLRLFFGWYFAELKIFYGKFKSKKEKYKLFFIFIVKQ